MLRSVTRGGVFVVAARARRRAGPPHRTEALPASVLVAILDRAFPRTFTLSQWLPSEPLTINTAFWFY